MASGPTYIRIGADTADVTAKLALSKAEFQDYSAELRKAAAAMRDAGAGASEEMKAGLAAAAQGAAQARAQMASLNLELKESIVASGGAASGFVGMRESIEATSAPIRALGSLMSSLGEAFFIAFAGERMISAIEHTAELGASLIKLSEQTGVAVETLSGLHYAAEQVDVEGESLDSAIKKLGKSIDEALKNPASNAAAAFQAMGISQDYLRENSNNILAVFLKMADAFRDHADGANADAIAMATLSRGGVELIPVLRQGSAAILEQIDKQKQLGSQITGPMAEAMKEHVQAVKDMEEAWSAVGIGITNYVVGPLTWLAKTLSDVKTDLMVIGLNAFTVAQMTVDQGREKMHGADTEGIKLDTLKPGGGKGDGKPAFGDLGQGGADKAYYAQWKEQLDQQLLDLQLFGHDADAYELNFWQQKLQTATAGGKTYAAARREIVSSIYSIESAEHREELADAQRAAQQETDLVRQTVTARLQQGAEETASVRQSLADIKQARDDEFANYKLNLEEERDAAKGNVAVLLQLDDELAVNAALAYGVDNANFRAALKQKSADLKAEIDQQMVPWKNLTDGIGRSFETMFNGILSGTQTFRQMMANMASNLLASFAQMGIKEIEAWTLKEIRKVLVTEQMQGVQTAAVSAGEAERLAVQAAADGEGMAAQAVAGSATVMGDAYKAAAGAYAALAGIPIIGPVIAPVAAGVAFAAVSAFDLFSASGGFDVGPGVNPITQLHSNEMVLPANIADGIRNMTSGQSGGSGQAGDVNFHVYALDSSDVKKWLSNNARDIAKTVSDHWRFNASTRPNY